MGRKIYAIRKEAPRYKQLDLEILDITRHAPDEVDLDDVYDFSENNIAMSSWWTTPDTKFIDYGGEAPGLQPDISVWLDATLVLSPKAHRLLCETLAPSGEFLPVKVGQEMFYIFNCRTIGEVDEKRSEFVYDGDIRVGTKSLAFKDNASELLVFKTPLESCSTLFCSERFKNIVTDLDLKGVLFDGKLIPEYMYADDTEV